MKASLVEAVRRRAGDRCEYCLLPALAVAIPFHVDHVVARKHGGGDELANLAFACSRCNRRNGSDLSGIDPLSGGDVVRLFDPRGQTWSDHFDVEGTSIVGRTAVGRATVRTLMINHPADVARRAQQMVISAWPPALPDAPTAERR